MKPKTQIVHLPVYQPGKSTDEVKKEFGLNEIVKLASNENPYGCSHVVREALLDEFDNTSVYPDGASQALAQKLGEFLGLKPSQLIFGAGSDEVVLMIARAFLVPGDETVMADRTFPQYKHNAEVEGARCVLVPLKDGKHDLDAMLEKVNERTKVVWICCPNNPTGTINTHEEVERFMDRLPDHVLVVFDEAYVEYNTSAEFPDSLKLLAQYKNFIVLRTFSKIYGLASLRIGYGIGHPELIHTVNQVREPFNTTRYAQAAAVAALSDQDFVAECRNRNADGLEYLKNRFDEMGLTYFPAYGNFIMVDVRKPADQVFQGLLKQGVIVRGGHQLGFPTMLRVTVGSREQNDKFLNALQVTLEEVH